MKRFWKIFGISLGSLIGFLLIVVFLACYVIFTPKRLTPIVQQVADKVLTCPYSIGSVNLTFFSTFPQFGIEIDDLYIINPQQGAPSDTVLVVPKLLAGLHLMKAIDGDISIHQFKLRDIEANLFIDTDGQSNFDVLSIPSNDTPEDSNTGWTLRSLQCSENLTINAQQIHFVDLQDTIQARAQKMDIKLGSLSKNGVEANIHIPHLACRYKDWLQYDSLSIDLYLPVELVDSSSVCLKKAQIAVNEFSVDINGTVDNIWSSPMAYNCDLSILTNDWQISSLLKIVPDQFSQLLPPEVVADGKIQLAATATGVLDDTHMPLIDAQLFLKQIEGHYDMNVLPYYINEANADISAHIDLNEKQNTKAVINHLFVRTGETSAALSGIATEILVAKEDFELSNPLCEANVRLDIDLKDVEPWLPEDALKNSSAKGHLMGEIKLTTRLNDIVDLNPNHIHVEGLLQIADLNFHWKDSLIATADTLGVRFTAPKKGITDENIFSWNCDVEFANLTAKMEDLKLDAIISSGTLDAGVEVDTKDTTHLPTLDAGFSVSDLKADFDTIHGHATNTKGHLTLTSSRRNKTVPRMKLTFDSEALEAHMDNGCAIQTKHIGIEANSRYNKNADFVMLKWNPRVNFDLQSAHVNLPIVGVPIAIPQIKFNYTNKACHIDTSRIVIGHSDFCLSGDFTGLGKWLRQEGELEGQLMFTSKETDLDELMSLVNRVMPSEENNKEQSETQKSDTIGEKPFMVPNHVNLDLATSIAKADIMQQTANNLNGLIHIRDGKLILEEVGFICKAAKLSLTAMYKTPRENHLFLGFNVHMTEIDIAELISLIPSIDTMMPMLSSFQGKAQFHLALESYFDRNYQLKTSTTRGACSIEGKDLVVLDGSTFRKISSLLMFSPKTKNIVDSLSVEATLYKNQIDIYPFCVSIDNYMAALGGRHNLDNHIDYHVSLLKPFYLGVDIKGSLDDMDIHLAKCRYAEYFKPVLRHEVDTQNANLRKMIRDALHSNTPIKPKNEE